MTVGERAREVGLLRAAGATRLQLSRFVFSGALLLGVTGSARRRVPRVPARAADGRRRERRDRAARGRRVVRYRRRRDRVPPSASAITVLAAIEPALAAARISPVEALRARFDLPSLRGGRLDVDRVHLPRGRGDGDARLAAGPRERGRRTSDDGLRRPALRDPRLAVPHAAAGPPPRPPDRARAAGRGAPGARLARPRPEPDDADPRVARDRPGDGRRARLGGAGRSRLGVRVARGRRARRRDRHLHPARRRGRAGPRGARGRARRRQRHADRVLRPRLSAACASTRPPSSVATSSSTTGSRPWPATGPPRSRRSTRVASAILPVAPGRTARPARSAT